MQSVGPKFQAKVFLSLIRSLFPKWNFFDRIAYKFELQFKVPDAKQWETFSFELQRSPLNFIFNTEGNLSLAQVSLLEHFARDIQELQIENELIDSNDVQNLTTFKMIRSLVQGKIEEYDLETTTVQIKVVAISPSEKVDIYISDWFSLDPV